MIYCLLPAICGRRAVRCVTVLVLAVATRRREIRGSATGIPQGAGTQFGRLVCRDNCERVECGVVVLRQEGGVQRLAHQIVKSSM